jgi:hypothetical protein
MGNRCCKWTCCLPKHKQVINTSETAKTTQPQPIQQNSTQAAPKQETQQTSSLHKSVIVIGTNPVLRGVPRLPIERVPAPQTDQSYFVNSISPIEASDRSAIRSCEDNKAIAAGISGHSESSFLFYDKNSQLEESISLNTARENLAQAQTIMRNEDLSSVFIRIKEDSDVVSSESLHSPENLSRVQIFDFKALLSSD